MAWANGLVFLAANLCCDMSYTPCQPQQKAHTFASQPVRRHRAPGSPLRSLCCGSAVLPNGLRIRHVSRPDVPFLYREVFEEQSYVRHGISLRHGRCSV